MNIILNCILIVLGVIMVKDVYRNLVSSSGGKNLYNKYWLFTIGILFGYVTVTNAIELIGRLLWNA